METKDRSNRESMDNEVFGISHRSRWEEPAVADAITRGLEYQEEEARNRGFLEIDAVLRKAYNAGGRKKILSYKQFCIIFLSKLGMDDKEMAKRLRTSIGNIRVKRCQALKKLRVFASS